MFYSNFLKLCNEINKAPSAVAVELGFQKSSVTKWSRGTLPTKANQLKIANYFEITVEELMNDEDTKKFPAQIGQENSNKEDIKLALFGEDGEVTDEMWEEALFAAQLIKERHKRKKKDAK